MIKENNIKFIFLSLSLLLIILIFFFPFFWIITSSFKSPEEIIATSTTIIPRSFTLEHYNKILFNSDFFIYLKNSLIVSFSSMIISIILSVSAAYGLHKLKFYGNKFVEYSLLVTYAFPGVILLVPIYLLFAKVNLLNSYFALIIVNVLFATPFAVWMLKAFFKLIPNEIEEAAYIDGASRYIIISRIIVPSSCSRYSKCSNFLFYYILDRISFCVNINKW